MHIITHQVDTLYRYNGKFYKISDRKRLEVNDIFIDGRDYNIKLVCSSQDIYDMSYVAPELYVILEEVTIQN
jgi:hypothetical protein